MTKGYEMGYRLINTYFQNMQEIWGSEVSLYYPGKYAGTTDLVCVYRDKPCIMDFKQSVKPKKRDWIDDYFHQLAAYALAHDVIHGTNIDYGVVLMAVQDGTTMEFSTAGQEFVRYKEEWMKRVEKFYEGRDDTMSVGKSD
jgi:genome maintenance exonuclease 1